VGWAIGVFEVCELMRMGNLGVYSDSVKNRFGLKRVSTGISSTLKYTRLMRSGVRYGFYR
jgi:hypothetical protein